MLFLEKWEIVLIYMFESWINYYFVKSTVMVPTPPMPVFDFEMKEIIATDITRDQLNIYFIASK